MSATDVRPVLQTALAGHVGQYREEMPVPALRPHFQCVWTNSIPSDHFGPIVVVPDGCIDVLWRNGRLRVAGPDVTAARPTLPPGTTVLGIRFQPGAATSWLGLPMSKIVGREVDLADLWGRQAHDFSQMIGDLPTVAEQLNRFQAVLAAMIPLIEAPSREAAAVFGLVKQAARLPGATLTPILDRLDISERTLRRRSRDHFGYGPKTLGRILRFQRFLAIAKASGSGGLSGMALEAGYADQAHLSRDIRSLCGMSAAALVRQVAM